MKPSTTTQRTAITVNLVGRKGGEDSVIQAGRITIDLKKLEEGINTRHHIFKPPSWSNVYLSLIASATIDGQATTKRAFYNEMLPLFKQACRKGNIALEATKLNGENPAPSAGYAKAICQYFDLPNTAPRLKKLLLETEKKSIKKGKTQREETAKYSGELAVGADRAECENTLASNEDPSLNQGILLDGNSGELIYAAGHSETVSQVEQAGPFVQRAAALRRPSPTCVRSGGDEHRLAHRTAAQIVESGPRTNPYALIHGVVDAARGSLGRG